MTESLTGAPRACLTVKLQVGTAWLEIPGRAPTEVVTTSKKCPTAARPLAVQTDAAAES
jgi:hypothetical protein